ncbi:hypothetical protein [Accumulibacter sp.]|uniref:hypothetical protein n=1 Tax=Accumulibacter sp. TaxID=2053492 RepID=UPI0025D4E6BF|nr:hypothetical protein [Accumulibacter sp.]MCM8613613.1 hypothetical protein [Accumulibacter sp.]MCM8637359.1 hypothetical protein [Accumulibacter sp.]MCM8638965.1 hypothetical protein [Accumulibacter sp.]
MDKSPEAVLLHSLFRQLAHRNVRFAVMRNHEPLPESAGGSDLDLMVHPADGEAASAAIEAAVRDAHGVCIGVSRSTGFFKTCAFGTTPEAPLAWWGLCIDVNVGLFYKGQSLLSAHAPWPILMYRNIPVLTDGFAGILGVLKEVLNNRVYPERYATAARRGVEESWDQIAALLAPLGHKSLVMFKEMALAEAGSAIRQRGASQLGALVGASGLASHPLELLLGRLGNIQSKLGRYLRPQGKLIAILGVDGAGKSTLIDAIKPVLDQATHNSIYVQHLKPGLLPPLARLKGKSAATVGATTDPHGAKPSGRLGSSLRLLYLMLDYSLGYWLKIRPRIAKLPTVVIFDRYAYDMILDPWRFRINLPIALISLVTKLAPLPDRVFCLHGDPQTLANRKNELPLAEVARQVRAIKTFAAANARALLVSTDGPIEQTRDEVLMELAGCCSRPSRN